MASSARSPGRTSCGALDAPGSARADLRQHALQRSARRAADVIVAALAAPQVPQAGRRDRAPAGAPGHGEYHLTDAGRELEALIMMMGEWGARWVRSRLERGLGATLLMWDMHAPSAGISGAPRRGRLRVHRRAAEQAALVVSEGDAADLCVTDPLRHRSVTSGGPAHHDRGLDRDVSLQAALASARSRRMVRRIAPPFERLARAQRVRPDQAAGRRRSRLSEPDCVATAAARRTHLLFAPSGSGRRRPRSASLRSCRSSIALSYPCSRLDGT